MMHSVSMIRLLNYSTNFICGSRSTTATDAPFFVVLSVRKEKEEKNPLWAVCVSGHTGSPNPFGRGVLLYRFEADFSWEAGILTLRTIRRQFTPCFAFLNFAAKSATSAFLTTRRMNIIVLMSSPRADAAVPAERDERGGDSLV
ncbi:hypothetical protein EVAR_84495_1 [Eumeta japonica]|uniref:Uncharacterized protein n=1 Tax=Eumeta variegata TaxID=151549 RepID=A0A4C1UIL4_EUMVA|nr:hypothetical protein EVAR_84495_1 [Eumeta japonica]